MTNMARKRAAAREAENNNHGHRFSEMSNAEISKRANDDRANNRGADGMTGAMAEEQRRLHAIAVRNDCPAGGIWDE